MSTRLLAALAVASIAYRAYKGAKQRQPGRGVPSPPPGPPPSGGTTENKRPSKTPVEKQTIPESLFDDLPVKTSLPSDIQVLKVPVGRLKDFARDITSALMKDGFFVLALPPELQHQKARLESEMARFFALPMLDKMQSAQKLLPAGGWVCGYDRVFINNIGSTMREKEVRECFDVHLASQGDLEWPSEDFKTATLTMFESLYDLSIQTLETIACGLEVPTAEMLSFIRSTSSADIKERPAFADATDTNFALFRYQDDQKLYKTAQRCMVHQDTGLLTLLPHATAPGIEILDRTRSYWLPMEQFLSDSDILVYPGRSLEKVTGGAIPGAIHRVVRQPATERFSMPFELKPNQNAILRVLTSEREEIRGFQQRMPSLLSEQAMAHARDNTQFPQWVVSLPHISLIYCDLCTSHVPIGSYHHTQRPDYDLCPSCFDSKLASLKSDETYSYTNNDFEQINSIPALVDERPIRAGEFFKLLDIERLIQFTIREGKPGQRVTVKPGMNIQLAHSA